MGVMEQHTPTTASAVGRALTKAGFARSKEYATNIRGYHQWNAGYTIQQGNDCVFIGWRNDSYDRTDNAERRAMMKSWMADSLRKAGYTVEDGKNFLIVTKEAK